MHRVFEQYLHHLALAADKHQLREAIKGFAGEFGLHSVAYLTIPRTVNHRTRVVSTYAPEWITHYLSCRYEKSDPVIAHARRQPQPFDWGPDLAAVGRNSATQRFFDEAAAFGINYGLTIPIQEDGVSVAAMTFTAERRSAAYRACVRRHGPVLQFASYCFHTNIQQKLNRSHAVDVGRLSHRQNQCMEWSALGKTAPDIAEILHIKPRTAVYHLELAKRKLGARTIGQAHMSFAASREGRQDPCLPHGAGAPASRDVVQTCKCRGDVSARDSGCSRFTRGGITW
jgi:LuxR family transcriptional regulator, activator of conjugal transfer of Ti plasmids